MTLRIRKLFSSNIALASTLVVGAVCWAPSVSALDFQSLSLTGNYYGGVGFGGSSIEPRVNDSGFSVTDNSDGGVQLFIGRDLTARISLEGYYSELGDAALSDEANSGRIGYSAVGASGLLYLLGGGGVDSLANRSGLNIYARAGAGRLNNEGLGIAFNRKNDWHLSTGLGVEYNLRNGFGVRGEFHNFDSDARVVSFNLVKRFGVQKRGDALPLIIDKVDAPLPVSEKDEAAASKTALASKDSDGDGVNDRDDKCLDTREGVSVDANGCDFTGVLDGVTFTTGSADLTQQGSVALDKVVAELKKNPQVKVSIQAHTDNRGAAAANMALSRKRAETVVRYLVDIGGIDLGRMSAIGYGESRPRQSNRTDAGRKANRRVEIKTVK